MVSAKRWLPPDCPIGCFTDNLKAWYTYCMMSSFCCAILICSANTPVVFLVAARCEALPTVSLRLDRASALSLWLPFRYSTVKLYSCNARAQRHNIPSILCSDSHCNGFGQWNCAPVDSVWTVLFRRLQPNTLAVLHYIVLVRIRLA